MLFNCGFWISTLSAATLMSVELHKLGVGSGKSAFIVSVEDVDNLEPSPMMKRRIPFFLIGHAHR